MAEQPTPPPADPLDPIRAWLAEIDAKLAVRTRVLLVLAAIAIGTAAASLFVALDSDDDSEGAPAAAGLQQEVAELRGEVEGLRESIDAVSNAAVDAESGVNALEARLDALEGSDGTGATGTTGATGDSGSGGAAPGEAEGANDGDGGAASGGAASGASKPGGAERAEAITEPAP
jgi:hypothetical protein